MLDIDKLYDLPRIQESKSIITTSKNNLIIELEKSYYDTITKANKEYIELQKKKFRSFYNLDKTEEKYINKEIIKVLFGKQVRAKYLDQWFNKTTDKILSLILNYSKDINFRYKVIINYSKKDKYSDYIRSILYLPEDIILFNIKDKDIERDIKNNNLYKQLENILDLTDIDTWKTNPISRNRLFSKKLRPNYIFGNITDIDLAMNKTHCLMIKKGQYKVIDLIKNIEDYNKNKKVMVILLISTIKDIKDQLSLFKSNSEPYIKSFPEQFKLTKAFLDDIDYIMDNVYYIYRRFIKQINDNNKICSIVINEIYDKLIKYRNRENNDLNYSYNDNKRTIDIDKRIG